MISYTSMLQAMQPGFGFESSEDHNPSHETMEECERRDDSDSDFQKGIYYSADQEQPRTESTFDETESTPSSENVDNFFSTAEEESLGTVTVEVEESGSESRTISGSSHKVRRRNLRKRTEQNETHQLIQVTREAEERNQEQFQQMLHILSRIADAVFPQDQA